MSFESLFAPLEHLDEQLTQLFEGAPLAVPLGIAFVLGLRHASDPDHLVAVTSLLASDGGDVRGAARIGGWWGFGHDLTLLLIGVPLIVLKSSLPGWLERGAEAGVGLVILLLAGRVVWKWLSGDYRTGRHRHQTPEWGEHAHRHLHHAAERHAHERERTPVISMAALTAAFAWILTRPIVEPVYRAVLIPLLGAFGLLFGLWYAGIG